MTGSCAGDGSRMKESEDQLQEKFTRKHPSWFAFFHLPWKRKKIQRFTFGVRFPLSEMEPQGRLRCSNTFSTDFVGFSSTLKKKKKSKSSFRLLFQTDAEPNINLGLTALSISNPCRVLFFTFLCLFHYLLHHTFSLLHKKNNKKKNLKKKTGWLFPYTGMSPLHTR